jgi:hypothetical protein
VALSGTISDMDSEAPYVARFGWTGKTLRLVLVCLVFLAVAVGGPFVPGNPVWMEVVIGLFSVCALTVLVKAAVSHALALRVDEAGVTLGGTPMRRRSSSIVAPWQNIEAVVLWTQDLGLFNTKMHYVGVRRKPGALLPPMSERMRRVNTSLVPHVPSDIARASVPVNGWNLDRARLEAAVSAFGGGVRVVELTRNRGVESQQAVGEPEESKES